jgi:hypothetical protein
MMTTLISISPLLKAAPCFLGWEARQFRTAGDYRGEFARTCRHYRCPKLNLVLALAGSAAISYGVVGPERERDSSACHTALIAAMVFFSEAESGQISGSAYDREVDRVVSLLEPC